MPKQIDLAEAQFIGYRHKEGGYSAKELADQMGLTKREWKLLRDKIDLRETDKNDIDSLFKTD